MTSLNLVSNYTPKVDSNDLKTLQSLQDSDNRSAMYLHYFELSGEDQAYMQAKISSFSGFQGAVADCANQNVIKIAGSLYPQEGVVGFSNQISQDHLDKVRFNIQHGGNGILSSNAMQENAKKMWDAKGLGPHFPGNALKLFSILKEPQLEDLKGVCHSGACTVNEILSLGRIYGFAKQHFSDPTKYQWYYKKVHNKHVSCAVERATGKLVFTENSKQGLKIAQGIHVPEGTRLIDAIKESVIPFAPVQGNALKPNVGKDRTNSVSNVKPQELTAAEAEKEINLFLKGYGLTSTDLSPEETQAIVQEAKRYAALKPTLLDQFPFDFFQDALGNLAIVAQAKNKPKLMRAALMGQEGLGILKMVSKLPDAFVGAPSLFAAFNPVMALGMAIFSFSNLFSHPQEPNQFQPILDQLNAIRDQIHAMHQDMIDGFNLLFRGQQNLLETMVQRFDRLENIVRHENECLGLAMMQSFAGIESYLSLIHNDLSYQVNHLYVQPFHDLTIVLKNAISRQHSAEVQKNLLNNFQGVQIVLFEDWIISKSCSGMLNGYRYVRFLEEHQMAGPEAEQLVNSKLVGENVQLECMVGYLGETAAGILGSNAFEDIPVDLLINPTFWIKGVETYLALRRAMLKLRFKHDGSQSQLRKIIRKGEDYIKFVTLLRDNLTPLFGDLLQRHSAGYSELKRLLRAHFQTGLLTQGGYALTDRPFFASTIAYDYDEQQIRGSIKLTDLHAPILNFLARIRVDVTNQEKSDKDRFEKEFSGIVQKVLGGKSYDELVSLLDRPICPTARHKKNTGKGESHLEVWHNPEHFSYFEEYGFKIPLSVHSLFAHSAELKNAIPKSLYLAEMLGLGNFEITMTAKYVGGQYAFIDEAHKSLNAFGATYNYCFIFEVFFVTNQRLKICEFDCHTNEIPVDEMVSVSNIMGANRKRMDALHTGPGLAFEYWFLGCVNTKLAALNNIPKFTKVNRFVKTLADADEKKFLTNLQQIIENKLVAIRVQYQAFLQNPINQGIVKTATDSMSSSINLILAFMKLCGFESNEIQSVKQKHLKLTNNPSDGSDMQLMTGSQASAPPSISVQSSTLSEFQASVTDLIRTRGKALDLKGYRVAEVELMINALHGLETEARIEDSRVNDSSDAGESTLSEEEAETEMKKLLKELDLEPEIDVSASNTGAVSSSLNSWQWLTGLVQNISSALGAE